MLSVLCSPSKAQQKKVPWVGFLGTNSASDISARIEGFRQGLREIGYIEGQNIAIEYRWAEGKVDRPPNLATELVVQKVEIIVSHGEGAIRALKQATKTIPIVVGVTWDLVVTGHAASLARPGGNITGFVDTSPELSGKRLDLLKEILPKASRIAVLWNAANPVKVLDFKETEMAAQVLGLKLQSLEVKASQDFENHSKLRLHSVAALSLCCTMLSSPRTPERLWTSRRKRFAYYVWINRSHRRWRPQVLRSEHSGSISPLCHLRR
jgi:putative tryptophan/tyrosine transport system substrate-binding protein